MVTLGHVKIKFYQNELKWDWSLHAKAPQPCHTVAVSSKRLWLQLLLLTLKATKSSFSPIHRRPLEKSATEISYNLSNFFVCFFMQLFSELCIADPYMTSEAGAWSSPYTELNGRKKSSCGFRCSQRASGTWTPWECGTSARGPGIAFGRSSGHGFQDFGSQAALSGQITAQPRGWWARKGQSTEPDTGSCTTGAVRCGEQSMGWAPDLPVLPEKEKCHRLMEVRNRVSWGGLSRVSSWTEAPL